MSSLAEFVVTCQQSYIEDKDCPKKKNKESFTYSLIILYYNILYHKADNSFLLYIYIYIYIYIRGGHRLIFLI